VPLLHPSHLATLPKRLQAQFTSSLTEDGPGGSTPRRFASSQIHVQRMPDDVSQHCHVFSYKDYFIVEHPSNILST
jgi:hypothetical protein